MALWEGKGESLNKEPCPLPMWPNASQDKPNMHPTCPPGPGAVARNVPLGPRRPAHVAQRKPAQAQYAPNMPTWTRRGA